jgi:hypothetical protein
MPMTPGAAEPRPATPAKSPMMEDYPVNILTAEEIAALLNGRL